MRTYLSFLLLLFSFALQAKEYTIESVPNPQVNDASNFVSNPDGILSPEAVAQVNQALKSLRDETGSEVAVVVVESIGMDDIKDFAVRLFQEWSIGKKKTDNGVLVLFVLDQRKVTFEVGYGLEGTVTDAMSKRIQMQSMIPEFGKGDYNAGMVAGIRQLSFLIRKEPVQQTEPEQINWGELIPTALAVYAFLSIFLLIIMGNAAAKIKKDTQLKTNLDRYTAVKAKENSLKTWLLICTFMLFFVVLFFLPFIVIVGLLPLPLTLLPAKLYAKSKGNQFRKEPIPCEECGGMMHFLPKKEEDQYLTPAQRLEESLGSVEYDVFLCDSCGKVKVFPLDKPSNFSRCPRCGTKAFALARKEVVSNPSYTAAGVQRETYKCRFCGYEENKNTPIPRLRRSSAGPLIAGGMLGGLGGGGGSGRGGGFGGGFGGGRSGGGGATSGW